MKTAFFINPASHTVKKNGSILAQSSTPGILQYNLLTFTNLQKHTMQCAKDSVNLVFIEGGDGTVHGVLTAFLRQKDKFQRLPKFVILPGGMTNLNAAHVGMKRPTIGKIAAIIADANGAQAIDLPLIKANYDGQIHYGFLFSTGALPNGTKYCHEKIHKSGINGAFAVGTTLLRVLFFRGSERDAILSPTPFSMKLENETIDDRHILSIATTLPSLMIGLKPFWGAGNGALHITHVNAHAKNFIRNIFKFLKKSQSKKSIERLKTDGLQSWSVSNLTLLYEGEMVLDGEFLPRTKKPISLTVSSPLSFIRSA